MIRVLDFFLAVLGLLLAAPLLALVLVIAWIDTQSPLFRQVRVGRHQRPFTMVKFRTMRVGTPSVATHLASATAVTPCGRLLRRLKLDELPQLWNVLRGEMSLVGPRPCLFEQDELVRARARLEVFEARPGITGLAQVLGVDMSEPEKLAGLDAEMIRSLSIKSYFSYVTQTVLGAGGGDRIRERSE